MQAILGYRMNSYLKINRPKKNKMEAQKLVTMCIDYPEDLATTQEKKSLSLLKARLFRKASMETSKYW